MADEALDHLPGCLAADGDPVINATRKPLHAVNQRCCEPAEIRQWNRLRRDHFVEGLPAFGGLELPETRAVIGGHLCAWEQSDEQELPSLRRRLPALAEALWRLERFDRLPSRRLPPP
jgi:hexosaminidase